MSATDSVEQPAYERWENYDSYAYLTVCDGPDDDSDEFAPLEPLVAGRPEPLLAPPGEVHGDVGSATDSQR